MSSLTPTSTVALPALAEPAYRPRPRDYAYLAAYTELITEDGHASQRALAAKLAITHQAVQQWQKRPGFLAWVHAQLRAGREDRFDALFERMYTVALKDASVEHATWCAKVLGAFKQPESPTAPQTPPIQVNIGFGIAGVPGTAPLAQTHDPRHEPAITVSASAVTPTPHDHD